MKTTSLLLNRSYEPIGQISWQRAVTLIFLSKAETLEEYDAEIRSSRLKIKIPAVIRLTHAYVHPRSDTKFSRMNIFIRDAFTCQYCENKFNERELTFDHVTPVVQGGRKTWDNIVTACKPCNAKKDGRTPDQARMRLLKKPRKPAWVHAVNVVSTFRSIPEQWKPYVYL